MSRLDRTYVACSGSKLVGSITVSSYSVSVPGGAARVAGISGLGIRPEFDSVPGRLALLDGPPALYDRVGFAIASKGLDMEIDTGHAVLRDVAVQAATGREVSASELAAAAEGCYAKLAASVPGVVAR